MLNEYGDDEYWNSSLASEGVWDEQAQWWIIHPRERVREHDGFLAIGSPGVDGIEFGYRKGQEGVWAYYPIGCEYRYLAPSLAALLEGWRSGLITV